MMCLRSAASLACLEADPWSRLGMQIATSAPGNCLALALSDSNQIVNFG